MRIVVPNLPIPILYDVAQCLETIATTSAVDVLLWNVEHKSIIDLFDELRPDIIFLHESQLDSSFQFICQNFPLKYVVVSETSLPTDLSKEPSAILISPLADIAKANNIITIRPTAQIPAIHSAEYNKDLASEILINTTNIQVDANIHSLFQFAISNYHTKIIGDVQVPLHNYLGKVDMMEKANFIKSARVIIDLNGSDYWNAAYLKVPAICPSPQEPFIQFNDEKSLTHNLNNILNKDLIRSKYIDTCYQTVLNHNTSYHFAAELFQIIK